MKLKECNHRIAIVFFIFTLLFPLIATGASIEVTSSADDGNGCTLRNAVVSINIASLENGCVNAGGGFGLDDRITFADSISGSQIILTAGELEILTSLSIDATDKNIGLSGNSNSRIFRCTDVAKLELKSLSLTSGSTFGSGGAIRAHSCPLTIENTDIRWNIAGEDGGAIHLEFSSLSVTDSTISDNTAGRKGGAIYSQPAKAIHIVRTDVSNNSGSDTGGIFTNGNSSMTIEDSIISNNDGPGLQLLQMDLILENSIMRDNNGGMAGAIRSFSGSQPNLIIIDRSIISGNYGRFAGAIWAMDRNDIIVNQSSIINNTSFRAGGIDATSASFVEIKNSTLSSNVSTSTSQTSGAAIRASGVLTTVDIINSTIAGNQANSSGPGAAGVYAEDDAIINFTNSIVANSIGVPDCLLDSAAVSAGADSIIRSDNCDTASRNVDPQLKTLADNGGATLTHAIDQNSPAWKSASASECPNVDQRDFPRGDGACDVGAYELSELLFKNSFE